VVKASDLKFMHRRPIGALGLKFMQEKVLKGVLNPNFRPFSFELNKK